MSKKHAKKFSCSSKKFVASLPYLRPLSDEEIDQLEIEASWQKFLPKATHEEDFFDWMLDIECAIIDREFDNEICRQMEMRYRSRVRHILPPTDDFPCFHYDDPLGQFDSFGHDEGPDTHGNAFSRDPVHTDHDPDPMDHFHQDFLDDLREEQRDFLVCPEQEIVRSIPLRGLPQQVRRELILEYCVH